MAKKDKKTPLIPFPFSLGELVTVGWTGLRREALVVTMVQAEEKANSNQPAKWHSAGPIHKQ